MSHSHLPARAALGTLLLGLAFAWSSSAQACACGCGVFDIGTSALLPNGANTTVFLQASYLDQDTNWAGSSSAPKADNDDKHIRSEFYVAGLQEMFNRDWGVMLELPYTQRHFSTLDDGTGTLADFNHGSIGDIRISGMYTGFSEDMSTGLTFGLKLATGDWQYPGFDRDTEIGTGTTDLLLGGYHQTHFGQSNWGGFIQAQLDQPLNTRAGYRPGTELDSAFGVYSGGWNLGNGVRLTPILQALVSLRARDAGANADPAGSGYQRLLLAPALELRIRRIRLYADVEKPVYQHVNGNQLVPHWQGKLTASLGF
jgi:hypothetical protein